MRLVQDLQIINEAVVPLYPMVPNPYTLLSEIPDRTKYFSVIDLKDAFYSVPLAEESQFLFAFEDPTQSASQLTRTVLPQGFRDSPHLFGQFVPGTSFWGGRRHRTSKEPWLHRHRRA